MDVLMFWVLRDPMFYSNKQTHDILFDDLICIIPYLRKMLLLVSLYIVNLFLCILTKNRFVNLN